MYLTNVEKKTVWLNIKRQQYASDLISLLYTILEAEKVCTSGSDKHLALTAVHRIENERTKRARTNEQK